MGFWTWVAIAIALIGGVFGANSGKNKQNKYKNDTMDRDNK
ncbi:hypothetical protein [Lentibacillus salicampi]|nr:hypothetical protein [Lentibacillus salicampi]